MECNSLIIELFSHIDTEAIAKSISCEKEGPEQTSANHKFDGVQQSKSECVAIVLCMPRAETKAWEHRSSQEPEHGTSLTELRQLSSTSSSFTGSMPVSQLLLLCYLWASQ